MLHKKYTNPHLSSPQSLFFSQSSSPDKGRLGGVIAFTLVELIVVVTILAILATIGFVSYSSYLIGVRDTNRIAQMTKMSDGLNLYSTRNALPIPEDYVEVQINGSLIGYQGYAGSSVLETIEYEKGGVDPKDNAYFTYYLTKDRKYFQLLGFLEEGSDLTSYTPSLMRGMPERQGELSLVNRTYANTYSERIPTVLGKKLGVLTDDLNTPIQEISSITSAGFLDIYNLTSQFHAHMSESEIVSGTGNELVSSQPNASCKRIKQIKGSSKSGIYLVNPEGNSEREVYCDMLNNGGGWMLVLKADGTETTFDYGSNYWNSANTLNETDFLYDTNEFKSSLYNTHPIEGIMLELDTNGVRKTLSLDVSASSLLSVVSNDTIFTDKRKSDWLDLVVGGELQSNCNAQGINPHSGRVRIGMTSNNETTCSSNDSALGIGLSDGASMSVGNYCNSTLCNGRTSSSSTQISSFGYLYIR